MSRIAAIGHLSRDVVSGGAPRIGGAVYYSARALARIGAEAHVAASCARTHRTELVPQLEVLGLPVRWYESDVTTEYSFHYEGDRRIMDQNAIGAPWTPEQALDGVADARWVHVGALTRGDFPDETLALLAEDGRKLLVDAQGLVRTAALGALRTDDEIGDALRYVEILKLNQEEAETLVGSAEPESLRALGVPEVILTLGSAGAYVVTSHLVEFTPAPEAPDERDPTGAGDTFSAAYLSARAGDADPVAAAHKASATVAAFLAGS